MIIKVDDSNLMRAAEVHSAAWQQSHKDFCSLDFVLQHTPSRQAEYLKKVMQNGADVYILFIENKAVGIVSICQNIIENLYVMPEEQNKGYGTKLLNFAVSECFSDPTLWILSNNPGAQRLYARNGFQLTGNKKRLRDDLYEVEMRFSLLQ